ncbi:carbohydrate ABC transporter permease [Caproiciproducens sp. LBM24188]|nr:carbohydrate ABC transporter permease [Oscillospiraceae bacterium]HHV31644.1 carbohydrate ABC transporter permease [Clostridiales bacterium]
MIIKSKGYKTFRVINVFIMLLVIVITLFPVLNILAKSFSDLKNLTQNTVSIIPKGFNVDTYKTIMGDMDFWNDYKNTVIYTVLGTIISLVMTTMFAYALSVPRLMGKKFLTAFVVFTMFFNGGIIPNYMIVNGLHMRNTVWAIVVPGAISTFNLIVMRTFFEGIPKELEEAASIDGMNTYGILMRIIIPLSKPIIATMVLFYAVGMWNSWFSAFLYLDHTELLPVTIYLRNLIAGAMSATGADADSLGTVSVNIKYVTIVLTSVPILCVYPFLQKYFVQGVMIGSVKG